MEQPPEDENRDPNQPQPSSTAGKRVTAPVKPVTPGEARTDAITPTAEKLAKKRVAKTNREDSVSSDENDSVGDRSDVHDDDGFGAYHSAPGGHTDKLSDDDASASVVPAATPALTTPLVSEPTSAASLEEVITFLEKTGPDFNSIDDYAGWFVPTTKLMLEKPAKHQAFMQRLVQGLIDTASEKRLIAGVLKAYEQCGNDAEKLELCHNLHEAIYKNLGSLRAAETAIAKNSTTASSPDGGGFEPHTRKKSTYEDLMEMRIVASFQAGLTKTQHDQYKRLLLNETLKETNPGKWVQAMSEILGLPAPKALTATSLIEVQQFFAVVLTGYIDNARRISRGIPRYVPKGSARAVTKPTASAVPPTPIRPVTTHVPSSKPSVSDTSKSKASDVSDDSMSENDDLAFTSAVPTPQATSDAMQDRLKKARGTLEGLESSGAKTPTRDPSDETAVLPLIPQKTAQEESASQNSTPKPANGVAGTEPIDNDEWNKMVKRVSAHMEAQGYKVDLEFTGGTGGHASFSSKTPPPEGTLSMTRDEQSKLLRIVSNLKPAQPELLIRSFYETGQRHAVVKSSESADHTKGLLEASKKYSDMTLELAPAVLAEFKAKYPDLVNELTAKSKPAKRRP